MSATVIRAYGHDVVVASVAATGAGIAIAVDRAADHSTLSEVGTGLAVTVPIALYVLTVWVLYHAVKPGGLLRSYGPPLAALVVLATSLTPAPVLLSGLVLAALVALSIATGQHEPADEDSTVLRQPVT